MGTSSADPVKRIKTSNATSGFGLKASVRCIAAIRPELELKPTCQDNSTHAIDLKRHFATVNCGIAKGSFNHVVGEGKHVGSHLDAERSRRVQVDDEREFGRSSNLGRRTFNRHRYF
jgi:hypothetical protein